ncbi:hypothetical protein BH09ACT8_BH09ACT8_42990 [soil metagenome]
MTISVRPRTRLMAALLAAGVVAAGPTLTEAGDNSLPALSHVAVQPASFITDALLGFGDVAAAGADTVSIGADALLGLNYSYDNTDFGLGVPFNPLFAAAIALQDPTQIGSLLSYVSQLYLNPSDNYQYYTYPYYLKAYVLESLANVLPAPLNTAAIDAMNAIADGIDNVFTGLPDPTAAAEAMAGLYNTGLGNSIYAGQLAIAAPVYAAVDVAYYLSYLPADLEATFEASLQNPGSIPGLVSNLIYNALDPSLYGGLLGNVAFNLVNPALYLPAPIGGTGGLVDNAYTGFVDGVTNLLNTYLPAPISPYNSMVVQSSPAASLAAEAPSTVDTTEAPVKKAPGLATGAPELKKQHVSVSEVRAARAAEAAPDATAGDETQTPAKATGQSKAGKGGASSGPRHSGKSRGGAAA